MSNNGYFTTPEAHQRLVTMNELSGDVTRLGQEKMSLEAENERLREALERIATSGKGRLSFPGGAELADFARAALAAVPEERP